MRLIQKISIAIIICMLSSCSTTPSQSKVKTNTVAFFDSSYNSNGFIYVKNVHQVPKPMFDYYRVKIEKYLRFIGFEVVHSEKEANKVLTYELQIDNGTTTSGTRSYSAVAPQYNSLNSKNPYSYGTTERTISYKKTIFRRELKLEIFNIIPNSTKANEPTYTATTVSEGSCNNIAAVFDEMLVAMFHNFDSANGQNRKLTVAGKLDC